MHIDVTRTKKHETRWSGTLSQGELNELLREALREALGAPRYGLELDISLVDGVNPQDGPSLRFELVHDHDWHLHSDD